MYAYNKVAEGPVVQNFVILTLSLSPQFVNCISTSKAIHYYFLLKKCENPLQCIAKDSHIFQKKMSVFVIWPFEILAYCYLTTSLILNNWPLEFHEGKANDTTCSITLHPNPAVGIEISTFVSCHC